MINGLIAGADFTGDDTVEDLRSVGFDFAAVYMEGLNKDATLSFVRDAIGKKFGILPICEFGGRGNSLGTVGGVGHAQRFRAALDAHGVPRNVRVANAESDYDADPTNPNVRAYYPAFWRELGQTVPGLDYAGGTVGRQAEADTGAGVWLTCSGSFNGSSDHRQVDLWQRCAGESGEVTPPSGKGIDTNYVLNPAIVATIWGLGAGTQVNPTPDGWVTVTEGMTDGKGPLADKLHNSEVHEAQLRLIRFSIDHPAPECDPGSVSGVHDYRTQTATGAFKLYMQQFQKAFGLPVWPPAPNLPFLHQIDEATINALRFMTTPTRR